DRVGRVPLPAHADLDDRDVDRRVGERRVPERGQHLEEVEPVLPLGLQPLVDHRDVRLDVAPGLDEPRGRDRLAVDDHALAHRVQVRRGEQPGAQARLPDQALDHPRRRGLAVGAGDVHGAEAVLGVAQQRHERRDPVERGLDAVLGRAAEDLAVELLRLALDRVVGRRALAAHRSTFASWTATARSSTPSPSPSVATGEASTATSTASVSSPMNAARSATACAHGTGTASRSVMRSATCRPAALRASCTWRTTSRAYPSPSSSSSSSRSSTTNPPPGSTAAATVSPSRSSTLVTSAYSPSCSSIPSTVTVPSSACCQLPARAAWMTRCTSRPSR